MIDEKTTIDRISIINSKLGIMMLNDIALFVHIVKTGSLSKAAELQALPAATVTRRLQKLEHKLKCKLINRSARQFNLTLEGQKLFDECSYLVESLEDRTNLFETSVNELSGKIKLLAPTNLAISSLSKAWSGFISKYEDIELEFVLDNKTDNFLATQADFAIRVGPQQSSDLYQVRIGTIKTILVASHEYATKYGFPAVPDDLDSHHLVVGSSLYNWSLQNKQDRAEFSFRPSHPRVVANEFRLIKQLTLDGSAISLLPVSEVISELSNGQLVQVLPMWTGQDRNIYIIWANGKLLTRRAKLLIEHLKTFVANVPSLQGVVPDFTP
ncbi:MAG: LysR family transcriptional regulator AphB [Moritella sp.]|jgi:LysR family transcriptional regulator AphB